MGAFEQMQSFSNDYPVFPKGFLGRVRLDLPRILSSQKTSELLSFK